MKINIKAALGLILGALYATSADAAIFVQAASGHPQFLATTAWSNAWNATGWRITDGRSIDPGGAVEAGAPDTWDVPLPISATNVTWNAVARTSGSGATFTNRICAFTSTGAFSNCGNPVAAGSTSSVLVPTDGSAYSQAQWSCTSGVEFCDTTRVLHHIKAF